MLGLEITTNRNWRQLSYRDEVPAKVLADQFDYLPDEGDGFLKYKNHWYHLTDFMTTGVNSPFPDWQGYASDSFFSGVLIDLSEDCEQYQIATYIQRG
jgi:hypothetical protein